MNNADLRTATHDQAMEVLRSTSSVVRMLVLRSEAQFRDEGKESLYGMYDYFNQELPDFTILFKNVQLQVLHFQVNTLLTELTYTLTRFAKSAC